MKKFNINPAGIKKRLVKFIADNIHKAGFKKAILGLSGGLDSSVCAYLAKEAVGPGNVIALIMPYGALTPASDIKDAKRTVKGLGIKSRLIDISDMTDPYFKKMRIKDKIRCGNKMARERMSILYDESVEFDALVLGTSNRTEILLGYGTIYGDTACAICPLGGLYKTQVYELAKFLKIPSSIIKKIPSAGLWPRQTDEGELGYTYKQIDKLLYYMLDRKYNMALLIKKGFSRQFIEDIKRKIRGNRFKRQLPKLGTAPTLK